MKPLSVYRVHKMILCLPSPQQTLLISINTVLALASQGVVGNRSHLGEQGQLFGKGRHHLRVVESARTEGSCRLICWSAARCCCGKGGW